MQDSGGKTGHSCLRSPPPRQRQAESWRIIGSREWQWVCWAQAQESSTCQTVPPQLELDVQDAALPVIA